MIMLCCSLCFRYSPEDMYARQASWYLSRTYIEIDRLSESVYNQRENTMRRISCPMQLRTLGKEYVVKQFIISSELRHLRLRSYKTWSLPILLWISTCWLKGPNVWMNAVRRSLYNGLVLPIAGKIRVSEVRSMYYTIRTSLYNGRVVPIAGEICVSEVPKSPEVRSMYFTNRPWLIENWKLHMKVRSV